MKKLCIYHGNCADGFGAAWVVRKALGERNVDFFPGVYSKEPPDVTGREVIMVDFSYKRDVLEEMRNKARSILVLDHHKTARTVLEGLEGKPGHDFSYVFDMNHSGAVLAWNYFYPDIEAPALLQHIEDRDLWLFKLEGTREIQATLFSYPYDFEAWDKLMAMPVKELAVEGAAIERKHHKDIAELVAVAKRRMKIGGFDVPVANLPYTLASDAGHLMAKGEKFSACYYDTKDSRVFSLRSTDEGEDVSVIAASYGGGGHRNAAGFRRPLGWEGE